MVSQQRLAPVAAITTACLVLLLSAAERAAGQSLSEIERQILTAPYWRDESGRFDPEQFDQWAQYEYGSQGNFIRDQKALLMANKLQRIVLDTARVSEGEARRAVLHKLEEAQIAYLALDTHEAPEGFEPEASAVAAFLETREPEARALYEERPDVYDVVLGR